MSRLAKLFVGIVILTCVLAWCGSSKTDQHAEEAKQEARKSGACVIDGVVNCEAAHAAWIKTHPKEYAAQLEAEKKARAAQQEAEKKASDAEEAAKSRRMAA